MSNYQLTKFKVRDSVSSESIHLINFSPYCFKDFFYFTYYESETK